MKWEIMITAKHPGVVSEMMHHSANAVAAGDILFISVNRVDEED